MNGPIYIQLSCRTFRAVPGTSPLQPAEGQILSRPPIQIQTLLRIQSGQNHLAVSLCWIPKTSALRPRRSEVQQVTLSRVRSQVSVPLWAHGSTPPFCCGLQMMPTTRSLGMSPYAEPFGKPTAVPADFSNATHRLRLRDQTTGAKTGICVTIASPAPPNCYQANSNHAPDPGAEEAQAHFVQTDRPLPSLSIGLGYLIAKISSVLFIRPSSTLTGLEGAVLVPRQIQTFFDNARRHGKIPRTQKLWRHGAIPYPND